MKNIIKSLGLLITLILVLSAVGCGNTTAQQKTAP